MLTPTQTATENGSKGNDPRAPSAPRTRPRVVDDHPEVRMGLRQLLEDQPDFKVVAVGSSTAGLESHIAAMLRKLQAFPRAVLDRDGGRRRTDFQRQTSLSAVQHL